MAPPKTASPQGILPLLAADRGSETPLHRQLYEAYRGAILAGRLERGQRLPSTRQLAAELGLSRITAVMAFEQLLAEGYVEARTGSGTYVAARLPNAALVAASRASRVQRPPPGAREIARASPRPPPSPWTGGLGAFRLSQPAFETFPFDVWSRLLAKHARNPPRTHLAYGDPRGLRALRETLARYLRTSRGVRCRAEQILVVSGSQQALELCARVLLDPGSHVWIEEPGYAGARDAFTSRGARLVPVPVDAEGLDVEAGVATGLVPRAVYVTPSHQYPLGMTMSVSRRLRLLEWARASGAWVIEDDYDSEYRYESQPVAALQGLDHDARVLYIGTFSKVLFPALRVGYLVVPEDLIAPFSHAREAMDVFPASLPQVALAAFLEEGHFARHLRRMRSLYRERRGALVAALERELGDELEILGAEAGLHLVAALREGRGDQRLSEAAARRGLWLLPLSTCYAQAPRRFGFVLGYGGTGVAQIRDGIRQLRRLLVAEGRG